MGPRKRLLLLAALVAAGAAGSGCGFRPVYATATNGSAPLFQRISVRAVNAPEDIQPYIMSALIDRMAPKAGESAEYELIVNAAESAERLAVQIDATVTRYNYRLNAGYALVDLETGERVRGSASAVVSYNIVSSQYSTLYAERNAQEKAAMVLAEQIERDLALRFSEGFEESAGTPAVGLDAETEILQEPRSGDVIETRQDD